MIDVKHIKNICERLESKLPTCSQPDMFAAEVAELRSIVLAAEAPTPVAEEKPAKGKKAAAEEEVPA